MHVPENMKGHKFGLQCYIVGPVNFDVAIEQFETISTPVNA